MFSIGYWQGGNSATDSCVVRPPRAVFVSYLLLTIVCAFVGNPSARSQTTLTWDTPGANSDIGNGPNWVGGVAPNFAGDATTDSAIFSTSTNTAVQLRNVITGDPFATVLFDAPAPAYTFSNATNELVILRAGNITNSSANTQTMTNIAAISLGAGAVGADTANKIVAANGNPGTKISFDFNQIKFNNPGSNSNAGASTTAFLDLAAGFDIRTNTLLGVKNGAVSSSLYVQGDTATGTGGTLFITGDSGTNTGRLAIDNGAKVRISHNNSLGVNSPGATTNHTILLGSTRNGRLELTGGITVNETFTLQARLKYASDTTSRAPAFVNVGGTNTLTGEIRYSSGGSAYNFGSEAGTLIIQSNLDLNIGGVAADRYFTFLGAGNFVVNGNLLKGSTATSNAAILKFGTGTTILNGAGNTGIGHVTVSEGTLALGSAAGVTFNPETAYLNDPATLAQPEGTAPRVTIDAGGTLDVSAIAGGFTLTQTLLGNGAVRGSLIMANGTHIRPGGTAIYNPASTDTDITGFTTEPGKLTIQNGSGDYNSNGVVDAADYVLWRKNPGGFGGTPAGYDTWRAKFGSSAASNLDMSAGSIFEWELGALSTSDPGVNFDQVVVGGNLVLGGSSSLNLDFTLPSLAAADPNAGDPFWNSPHSWKIIDTTTNTGSTNFASITNGTWNLGHFTTTVGAGADAGDIFLNYLVPGSGSAFGAAAVPEPTTWMLVLFGTLGSLMFRKRSFSWGLSRGAAAQAPLASESPAR